MSHRSSFPPLAVRRPVAPSPAVAGHRPLTIALALAACFAAGLARAQPTGAQAVLGSAIVTQNGSRMTVTTQNGAGKNHSAINWQSFSIPAGSSTWFAQPGATSTSINRVTGSNPSAIFGTLGSNGKLVLVNPSGITVGAGAVVDTAGFTASTLRMSDADALAGRLNFGGDGLASAALQMGGRVVARGGDVVLIAPNVDVDAGAVVQSVGGSTILAAGRKVAMTGRGLEGIHLELSAPADKAVNLGTLQGDSVGIFAGQLQHSGLAVAQSASLRGGRLVLRAQGDALVDGRLDASSAQGTGGSVDVLGNRVALYGSAQVDASGASGGGQVRIGGDYQGRNAAVPNAARTFVGGDVNVGADARDSGDGGRVIVWSDEATRMQGHLSARGGANGGDGGFAEVSGKQWLEFTGRADLRAPMGKAGTLLLDPNDITIRNGEPGETTANPVPTPAPSPPPSNWTFSGPESVPGVVTVTDLQDQLQMGNVQILTNGGTGGTGIITVNDAVTWSTAHGLGLHADGGIVLNAGLAGTNGSLSLYTTAGNITQTAGSIQVSKLAARANAGSVTLQQANQVGTLAGLAPNGFSFSNSGALTIGSVTVGPVSTPFQTLQGIASTSGNVSVQTTGIGSNLTVNYSVSAPNGTVSIGTSGGNSPVIVNAGNAVSGALGATLTTTGTSSDVKLAADPTSQSGILLISATQDIVVQGTGNVTLAGYQGVTLSAGRNIDFETGGYKSVTSGAGSIGISASTGAITGQAQISTSNHSPGDVTLTAPQGVSFGAINASATGSYSASGGTVSVTSTSGSISGDSIMSNGAFGFYGPSAGGPVTLTANNGQVGVGSISTVGGSSYYSDGSPGGDVTITAGANILGTSIDASGGTSGSQTPEAKGGAGGIITLTSTGGSITYDNIVTVGGTGLAGGAGGTVVLEAESVAMETGDVSIFGEIQAHGGLSNGDAGGAGGHVTVTAGRALSIHSVSVYGGDGIAGESGTSPRGGDAGDAALTSHVGDVQVSYIDAWGGNAAAGFPGGAGGTVTVTASTGNIVIGDCECSGGIFAVGGDGAWGGKGGDVTLSAPLGSISVSDVYVWGGLGGDDGSGEFGAGGNISISSGSLSASNLVAIGGDGRSSATGVGTAGGAGGSITITSTGTTSEDVLALSDIQLVASGGNGGSGNTSGGNGGIGGQITVNAPQGLNVDSYSLLVADGGSGGDSSGSASADRGGAGKRGGDITLNLGGSSVVSGYLSAVGGFGGMVPADPSAAVGGSAGSGGSVTVALGSGAALNGGLIVALHGGFAGQAGMDTEEQSFALMSACDGPCPPAIRPGADGSAGTLFTTGAGDMLVTGSASVDGNWTNQLAMTVSGSGTLFISELLTNDTSGKILLAGTELMPVVAGSFVNAGTLVNDGATVHQVSLAQNTGTVRVQTGELVLAGFNTNNGVIEIVAGAPAPAILSIGTPMSSGRSAETLTNLGTIRGRGTLNGSLVNSGIVAPGMSPGVLAVGGDFTQTSSGTLVMELAGTDPATQYDQLSVGGATVLGGSLQVLPFGSTPPNSGTFELLLGSAPTGSFSSVTVPIGFTGTLKAGGTPVSASPAPTSPPVTGSPPAPTEPPVASGPPSSPPVDSNPPSQPPPPPSNPPATDPPPTDPVASTPPPPPLPPASPPAGALSPLDQFIALLGEAQRGKVLGAINEQRGTVLHGLRPLEDDRQRSNTDGIVITDAACKP